MKRIIKRTAITLLAILLCFSWCTVSVLAQSQSWYTKRNKEHKQPTLDVSQEIIEKYGGYYVDKKYAQNSEEKVVYLTFDAGYENGNVEKILDALNEENVKGAFFILENLIIRNPELVKRMADEGHTVCNHTAKHKDMTRIENIEDFRAELEALEAIYTEKTGKTMAKFYRPPEGRYDEKSLAFANELGYKTIFWSLAYADWDNNNQPSADKAMKILLDNIHNGAIILLHPTSATNAEIMPSLIKALKADGYRFGTLDELIAK